MVLVCYSTVELVLQRRAMPFFWADSSSLLSYLVLRGFEYLLVDKRDFCIEGSHEISKISHRPSVPCEGGKQYLSRLVSVSWIT